MKHEQQEQQEQLKYINRDINWLEFNSRVLDEAADPATPLLEKLKFAAIFSSNLDEFIMVRIAGLLRKTGKDLPADHGDLFRKIKEILQKQTAKQSRLLHDRIFPELAEHGIIIASWDSLSKTQKNMASQWMTERIFPVLTPIGTDENHPFPLVPNLGLEMLIRLSRKGEKKTEERFAVLEVPSVIPRFIRIGNSGKEQVFLAAEELIRHHLDMLFAGCRILECGMFRVTRDMDLAFHGDLEGDELLSEIRTVLREKTKRSVIRLEYSSGLSGKSMDFLLRELRLTENAGCIIQKISGMLNLKSLFELAGMEGHPELHDPAQPPLPSPRFSAGQPILDTIRGNPPILLHLPYESFDPVVAMLEQAAADPDVLAVKQTLYRVGRDSPVIRALIHAARSGKQVTVLLELKARFDEENNIQWAQELAEAGAHVVYGVAGLKVHCKALMVIRREQETIRRYVYLSSGNFNSKTAKQYTDFGCFSDDPLLAEDVSALFNVITGFSAPPEWNRLLAAPFNLKDRMISMIDREARLSSKKDPGHIIIKANAVIDTEIIDHLYAAAKKYVKIDMIIRGICGINPYCLAPEFAKGFRIVSILDRYLEHGRIYYFRNGGNPEYYAGSSDLMPRNLRRRIEILFPVTDPGIRNDLDFILQTQLSDRRKGRRLNGVNHYSGTVSAQKYEKTRCQTVLYEYYRKRLEQSKGDHPAF